MSEVARRQDIPLGAPFTTMAEAIEFTKVIALSELIPKALRGKPANCLAVILYGQEIGLSQMQSMQTVHVVEGKPSMSAELWRAKLRTARHRFYIPCRICGGPPEAHPEIAPKTPSHEQHGYEEDRDDKHCKMRVIRGDTGERGDFEYTLDEAVSLRKVQIKDGRPWARSKLGEPLPWETATKDMLYARVTTRACRAMAPEIALGWVIPDEAEEIAERERVLVESTRTDQPVEQPPTDPAAEVADIEAEFAEQTAETGHRPYGIEQAGEHEVVVMGSEDGFTWRCDICRPGEPWTGPRLESYEDAMADHAHYAETAGER